MISADQLLSLYRLTPAHLHSLSLPVMPPHLVQDAPDIQDAPTLQAPRQSDAFIHSALAVCSGMTTAWVNPPSGRHPGYGIYMAQVGALERSCRRTRVHTETRGRLT
jgi:hypothetical protein